MLNVRSLNKDVTYYKHTYIWHYIPYLLYFIHNLEVYVQHLKIRRKIMLSDVQCNVSLHPNIIRGFSGNMRHYISIIPEIYSHGENVGLLFHRCRRYPALIFTTTKTGKF